MPSRWHGTTESPACSDGIDNDGDGAIDWDGAGIAEPDSICKGSPYGVRERRRRAGSCGLGSELALLLPVWSALRCRRRSSQAAPRHANRW